MEGWPLYVAERCCAAHGVPCLDHDEEPSGEVWASAQSIRLLGRGRLVVGPAVVASRLTQRTADDPPCPRMAIDNLYTLSDYS